MEADIGTTWHRMTSLFQIVEGGEYGWRSGWANQPDYYIDRLPALQTTGRSSPTGAVVYDHNVYPTRYQQSLFLADWSEGRILRVDTRPTPDGILAKPTPFVIGRPMNITDLDVSPDGAIYFCTGGRGTAGGIYAIRWTGKPKDIDEEDDKSIAKAIRQPQLQSAWGRQSVAMIKRNLATEWDEEIAGVAYSPDNPARYRTRALDLMQLLGPVPTPEMLIELSRSPNEVMRAKSADLLALHPDNELALKRLNDMLADSSATVQQSAASGLIRADATCNSDRLIPLLQSSNRVLAFLATKLLQRQPVEVQRQLLDISEKPRVVIAAALALAISNPDVENALASVNAMNNLVKGFVSDQDFIDLLRTYEVTLANAKLRPTDTPELRDIVAKEFPAGEPKINRQLIRLATFFQTPEIVPIALRYLDKSDVPIAERVDVSLYLRMIQHDWTPKERTQLLRFFEKAQLADSGSSYSLYVMNATREFATGMTELEAIEWLKEGSQSPNAALASLPKLPSQITPQLLATITTLDREIDKGGFESDTFKRLKTGITAILARSGDEASMNYLRAVWRRSPDRRPTVALALAQKPDGENWDYLVRSLGVIESYAADEILSKISSVDVATEDSQALRQVLLLGLRLVKEEQNPANAIALMEHWTGASMHEPEMDIKTELAAWQDWYRGKFPELPEPVLPEDQTQPQWSMDFIEQYLDGDSGKTGSIAAGAIVYTKAQCASCHRMGEKGTSVGPDLTSLTKRFTRRETIESILYPSHVISDQYASKKVMTRDGKIASGIMSKTAKGISIRTSDLQNVTIDKDDIEEIVPSKQSLMPAGLLDNLSPNDIRDLMCYLGYVPATPQVAETPAKNRITR
jgi:putative heme-binding domain-containing protein